MAGDLDPRFDPQFQRGYDPAVHRARAAVTPAPAVAPADPPVAAPPAPVATPDAPRATEPDEPDEEPRRLFPYRLVLLLASIAAIAGAGFLLWTRITADPLEAYYGSNPGILFRQQLVDSLLIPLLVAGLTGIILWLALGALRRRDDA